jgi:SAM-dependent methyltransferase
VSALGAIRCAWQEADELPRYRSLEAFLASNTHRFGRPNGQQKVDPDQNSLDIGCGYNPRNPFNASKLYGVDIRGCSTAENIIKNADLSTEPIPFPEDSFSYITAFDFLEHVPRVLACDGRVRFCFVELMNEVYRVCVPGPFCYPSRSFAISFL